MKLDIVLCLIVGVLLTSATGCSVTAAGRSPQTFSSAAMAQESGGIVESYLPETKVMLVSLEDQMREIELRLFNAEALPFSTYVPADSFTEQVELRETGTAVRFSFKAQGDRNSNAYIYFWVPKSDLTVEAIQAQLLGTQGLLAKENWTMTDRTAVVAYPWVKERIVYEQQTAQGTQSGAIFIGEQNGKAFYAVTSYPLTERDRFESQAALVLETLEFKN